MNTFYLKQERNCQWGILECGSDGDCLFHVVSFNQANYFNPETDVKV